MVTAGLTVNYVHLSHVEECPDLAPAACASGSPPPPERHVIDLDTEDLRLDAELGVTRFLSVEATLFLRWITQRVAYTDLAGARLTVAPDAGIHHRNETLFGPGDPWLLAHAGLSRGQLAASLRLGASIPLGSTVEDPFALGARGVAHEHFQLGTGTVDPIAAADARWFFAKWTAGAWALAKVPLYANPHGYQAGARVVGGLFAMSKLGLAEWDFTVGVAAAHEEAERWGGRVYSEGNLGRNDLVVDAAARWRFSGDWSAALSAQAFVYSDVVGAQITSPLLVELSLTRAFELWEHD